MVPGPPIPNNGTTGDGRSPQSDQAGFLADLSSRELTPELASMGTSWEAARAVDRQWEREKYPQLYREPEPPRSPTHDRSRHRDRDHDRDYGFGL